MLIELGSSFFGFSESGGGVSPLRSSFSSGSFSSGSLLSESSPLSGGLSSSGETPATGDRLVRRAAPAAIPDPGWLGMPQYWRDRVSSLGRPLRVIHISLCLCRGGTESWLLTLRKFLNPQRARLTRCVVVNPTHMDPAVVRELNVPVEAGGVESVRRAARDCDVLISWGSPLAQVLGDVRPPVGIVVAHGDSDWTREMAQLAAPVTDCFVAVSQRVAKRLGSALPVRVIPNGIDVAHLARTRSRRAAREELGFQHSDFVVGMVGRLAQEKRADLVIQALSRLPPRFKLLLVGWGELESSLKELADRLIPGRCRIVSTGSYLGDVYHAMDTFCLASEHEGFGLVLLEAMMCGLPVVSTDVGAVGELLRHRENGLVFDRTPEHLASLLADLESHPAWAAHLGAEAARTADETGHGLQMVRTYEDLFEELYLQKTSGKTSG